MQTGHADVGVCPQCGRSASGKSSYLVRKDGELKVVEVYWHGGNRCTWEIA
jgi:hypothetical protein